MDGKTIYTIGHSTRTIEDFVALLRQNGIDTLIDVRRFPGSRRYPHFGKEELPRHLAAAGIDYIHEEDFGGRRDVRPDSPNRAWRNKQFQGYADHMDSPEFQGALDRLFERAETSRQAVMCAEAVPWRCHRNLMADAILARGGRALHIIGPGEPGEHTLNKHARILENGRVVYPGADSQIDLL